MNRTVTYLFIKGFAEVFNSTQKLHPFSKDLQLSSSYQINTEQNLTFIRSYSPGQVVPMEVNIRIKHAGTANVSIVDTKSNTIVGTQLLYWSDYANEKLPTLPANNSAFSVTLPMDFGGKCATAGECVSNPLVEFVVRQLFILNELNRSFSGGGTVLARNRLMSLAWTSL